MKELEQILKLWHRTEQAGESAVLATIVKTLGSSYRLPGARMLLTRNRQRAGTVSGGCLEQDLVKKAWWLTEAGPVIRRYDTTPEGEIGSGFGLGCNGIIHVLLERLQPGAAIVLDLASGVCEQRQAAAVGYIVQPAADAGQRLLIDTAGHVSHNLRDSDLAISLEYESRAALSELKSRPVISEGREAFVEVLTPAIRLLVFGAGDDAVPLTDMARYLGWSVAVFDGRAHYARREKFPGAHTVSVRRTGDSMPAMDPWTVAVLMTHSYSQDLDILRELAKTPPRYIGMLGPRKRSAQLLADAGIDAAQMSNMHAPMGLDIGADGPEQVALAVIAEIQTVLNGRTGGPLKERHGSIHAPEGAIESDAFCVPSITCA